MGKQKMHGEHQHQAIFQTMLSKISQIHCLSRRRFKKQKKFFLFERNRIRFPFFNINYCNAGSPHFETTQVIILRPNIDYIRKPPHSSIRFINPSYLYFSSLTFVSISVSVNGFYFNGSSFIPSFLIQFAAIWFQQVFQKMILILFQFCSLICFISRFILWFPVCFYDRYKNLLQCGCNFAAE